MCNCGVAVRENNDVIVMDMCGGIFKRTSLQVSIRSRLPLAKGTEITEENSGKRYTVQRDSEVNEKQSFEMSASECNLYIHWLLFVTVFAFISIASLVSFELQKQKLRILESFVLLLERGTLRFL